MKYSKIFIFSILVWFAYFPSAQAATIGEAQLAKSVAIGSSFSYFESVATDNSGNVYVAGVIGQANDFDFGNGVNVTGINIGGNAVVVKYDKNGNAQWAKSTTSGASSSFGSVGIDNSGNVYAAGWIGGTNVFNFGNGVTVSGPNSSNNAVIVKYDTNGNAQWAKSTTSGASSSFESVGIDSNGNIVVGGSTGNGNCDFGNGVTVTGPGSYNAVVVKYNSSVNAQWAKGLGSVSYSSGITGVDFDNSGNVHVAGYGNSAYVVKYDTDGNFQWSKVSSSGDHRFNSVALDSSGNVFAVGQISGTGLVNFNNGVTVSGPYTGTNIVLVKISSSGTTQWAKSVTAGTDNSRFESVAVFESENIYGVGDIYESGTFDFGNNITVSGPSSYHNPVLLKYNTTGDAQWAKGLTSGWYGSWFRAVTTNSTGNIYAAGSIENTVFYDFGNEVIVNGTFSNDNIVLLEYEDITTDVSSSSAPIANSSSSVPIFNSSSSAPIANISSSSVPIFNSSSSAPIANISSSSVPIFNSSSSAPIANSSSSVPIFNSSSSAPIANSSSSVPTFNSSSSAPIANSSSNAPVASSSSTHTPSGPPNTSGAPSIKTGLPKLIVVGGTIMLLF